MIAAAAAAISWQIAKMIELCKVTWNMI